MPTILFSKKKERSATVWQDKGAASPTYKASGNDTYATDDTEIRPKHHGSQKRRSRQMSGYPSIAECDVIERMRGTGKNQLSRSQVVTKLIRLGLQLTYDNENFAMLEPRLEQTIDRKFSEQMNPLRKMQAKTLKDLEELRFILEGKSSPDEITAAKKLAVENVRV